MALWNFSGSYRLGESVFVVTCVRGDRKASVFDTFSAYSAASAVLRENPNEESRLNPLAYKVRSLGGLDNHGHSRTGIAHARPNLEKRRRKRGASVLFGGLLGWLRGWGIGTCRQTRRPRSTRECTEALRSSWEAARGSVSYLASRISLTTCFLPHV